MKQVSARETRWDSEWQNHNKRVNENRLSRLSGSFHDLIDGVELIQIRVETIGFRL